MQMRAITCLLLVIACSSLGVGCRTQASTAQIDQRSDACSLLPADVVGSIQGEKVVQAEPSQSSRGDLSSRRCFYRTENFNRSVDVEVIAGADRSEALSEFWNKRFHSMHKTEEEEESERASSKGSSPTDREQEDEHAKASPAPVSGLGDEAFWVSNQLNSTLYVLQSGNVVRVSIGGPDDANAKLERARAIVEKVFARK